MRLVAISCVRDEIDVIEPFVRHTLAFAERFVYCVTGILTFMPANVLGAGRWFNVAGVALAIALFLHARLRKPPAALESS